MYLLCVIVNLIICIERSGVRNSGTKCLYVAPLI